MQIHGALGVLAGHPVEPEHPRGGALEVVGQGVVAHAQAVHLFLEVLASDVTAQAAAGSDEEGVELVVGVLHRVHFRCEQLLCIRELADRGIGLARAHQSLQRALAVLGSLGTLFYRFGMQEADLSGLSSENQTAVTSALGTALEVARTTGNEAAPWIVMARESYAGGFALCCALATVTLLLLAAIAARVYARTKLDESRIGGH